MQLPVVHITDQAYTTNRVEIADILSSEVYAYLIVVTFAFSSNFLSIFVEHFDHDGYNLQTDVRVTLVGSNQSNMWKKYKISSQQVLQCLHSKGK